MLYFVPPEGYGCQPPNAPVIDRSKKKKKKKRESLVRTSPSREPISSFRSNISLASISPAAAVLWLMHLKGSVPAREEVKADCRLQHSAMMEVMELHSSPPGQQSGVFIWSLK